MSDIEIKMGDGSRYPDRIQNKGQIFRALRFETLHLMRKNIDNATQAQMFFLTMENQIHSAAENFGDVYRCAIVEEVCGSPYMMHARWVIYRPHTTL